MSDEATDGAPATPAGAVPGESCEEPAQPRSDRPGTDPPDHGRPHHDEPRHDQVGVATDHLRRLWAPWRIGYVLEDEPPQGCPFCVLPARDPRRDRESLILRRGEHAFVILNAYPYNPGHLMVVPYAHVAGLAALDDDTATELWDLGRHAVAVLERRLSTDGVNLGMNLGVAAGAGIADHLHLHAVPRWGGDTNFVTTLAATRVLPRALAEIYETLAPGFA